MRLLSLLIGALMMTHAPAYAQSGSQADRPGWRLVIHGGAGVIERDRLTPEQDREIRAALDLALQTGSAILARGGSALDAVEATAKVLEDDPHFNAGRGAVFTYQGTNEMDASIMDGSNRAAGAVTGVTATKNPISLARAVMEDSPHVFLSREGADGAVFQVDIEIFGARMRLDGESPQAAADAVMAEVEALGGTGGVIVVTPQGDGIYSFNTPGMYRGQASPAGRSVAIYGDEEGQETVSAARGERG